MAIGNELTLLFAGVSFASTAESFTDRCRRTGTPARVDILSDLGLKPGPR